MNRQQKKELRQRQTSRQLMGIRQLTDHGAKTAGGELVFFMIKPDNLSVLSGEGIRSRVKNLTDLLCGTQEVRLLALDSRESFQRNKDWYRQRLETEELPAIRELLRQDAAHLDEIQAATPPRPGSLPWSIAWISRSPARTSAACGRWSRPCGIWDSMHVLPRSRTSSACWRYIISRT